MPSKFVLRLLDASRRLLAWAEVHATGAVGAFPFPEKVQFVAIADGVVTALSVHWTDLDVRRLVPFSQPVTVQAGQIFDFHLRQNLWDVESPDKAPLPPVTVGTSVEIAIPTGSLRAVGHL